MFAVINPILDAFVYAKRTPASGWESVLGDENDFPVKA